MTESLFPAGSLDHAVAALRKDLLEETYELLDALDEEDDE